MKKLIIAGLASLLLGTMAQADPREVTLMPSELFGLFNALPTLGSKERLCKDGANEKPCTEQVKIPPGLGTLIALNLRVIKGAVEDYQWTQHKMLGQATGGSGYVEKGSRAEAEANYQAAELSRVPIKITLNPISSKELEDAKIDVTPAVRAVLLPILVD